LGQPHGSSTLHDGKSPHDLQWKSAAKKCCASLNRLVRSADSLSERQRCTRKKCKETPRRKAARNYSSILRFHLTPNCPGRRTRGMGLSLNPRFAQTSVSEEPPNCKTYGPWLYGGLGKKNPTVQIAGFYQRWTEKTRVGVVRAMRSAQGPTTRLRF